MSNASLDRSFTAFWRRHTTNHPEHRTRALRQLAYNAWRSGRLYESKARGAAREDVKAVGTVLGGEFHHLRPSHGLPDGTMLYAIDQAPGKEKGND